MSLDANIQSLATAVGTAIKGKISSSEKGSPNGVATLDGGGKIPSGQLPSYVDDVVEYSTLGGFPATGVAGILYIALDTNKQYRWAGSTYQQITSGAVDSVAGKTGVITLTSSDVGLGSVDNTSDANKNVLSATKWTTGRTLTIGSTGKTVDGLGNVSWSLAEVIGSQSANTVLIAPNGSVGTPTFRALVSADIPTLNQNTTGSAGSVIASEIIKFDTGTTEGTDLYTFNGSTSKTIDIKAGSGITFSKVAGAITISGTGSYTLPSGTSTTLGGIKLASDTVQATAPNTVTTTASRTYGIQVNASGQAVVNVPWVDTNTTYSNATTSVAGLMSATDKAKLDDIGSTTTDYVAVFNASLV